MEPLLRGRSAVEFIYDRKTKDILAIINIIKGCIKSEYIYSDMYPDEIVGEDQYLDDRKLVSMLTPDQKELVVDFAEVKLTSLDRGWYKTSLFWSEGVFSFSKWDADDIINKLIKGSSGATRLMLIREVMLLVAAILNKNWEWES